MFDNTNRIFMQNYLQGPIIQCTFAASKQNRHLDTPMDEDNKSDGQHG